MKIKEHISPQVKYHTILGHRLITSLFFIDVVFTICCKAFLAWPDQFVCVWGSCPHRKEKKL